MPSTARTVQLINAALASKGIVTTGNIWFVSSTATGAADRVGKGKAPGTPFATLAYAVLAANSANGVRANKGDVIIVMPGHAETISAAGTVTIDVAGLTILGVGVGSARPTFNFTATASTFLLTAANTIIDNCLFTGGIDAIVSAIVVSAADCSLTNCEFRDVTGQATLGILTTAGANRLRIAGHLHSGDSAAGADAAIRIVGGTGIVIEDFKIFGNFAVSAIDNATTATTNITIRNGEIQNGLDVATADGIVCVNFVDLSTGFVGPNLHLRLGVDSTSNAANITGAIKSAAQTGGVGPQVVLPVNVSNLGFEATMTWNGTASTDA